ncbi:NAD(P)H-binding protein [Zobellia nedashkovskayae]|uniref:NAD(P)H-binding protein n=1 Tax=Zobellia nedashkovskayae TaxID=2779510 RepID=UPI00188BB61B|nr:NAD(P)H-binding protein [Zobellia nedashkovskayae]
MNSESNMLYVVMLGASGAVGTETLGTLLQGKNIQKITLLGRSHISDLDNAIVEQHNIDITDASSYENFLQGHTTAICTLGVGQPSKISKEEFIKIDKTAVLDFATACKKAGVKHFQLLASVGISPTSSSFYLRTKGELVEALKALHFDRLSIFEPSMILTPTNRYGIGQAITLKVWPLLKPILLGGLRKYRGVPVHILGQAMANNIYNKGDVYEVLQWDDFYN